jgi:hypothetical protein
MLIKPTSKDKLDSLKINLKMPHKLELKNLKLDNKLRLPGKHKLKKYNKLLMVNLCKTLKKLNTYPDILEQDSLLLMESILMN